MPVEVVPNMIPNKWSRYTPSSLLIKEDSPSKMAPAMICLEDKGEISLNA